MNAPRVSGESDATHLPAEPFVETAAATLDHELATTDGCETIRAFAAVTEFSSIDAIR
jgi:hypothetical protein